MYLKFANKVDLNCSQQQQQKKDKLSEVINMLISLIAVIILQCIHTPKYHIVYIIYIYLSTTPQ